MSLLLDLATEIYSGLVVMITLTLATWTALAACCCGCRAKRAGLREFFYGDDELTSRTPTRRSLSALKQEADQWLAEKIRSRTFAQETHPFIDQLTALHEKARAECKDIN